MQRPDENAEDARIVDNLQPGPPSALTCAGFASVSGEAKRSRWRCHGTGHARDSGARK